MNNDFTIRTATLDDIPQLLVRGKENFDQMRFEEEGNAYEFPIVEQWLHRILPDENYIHLIAEKDGEILGYFAVVLTIRHAWHSGPKHAAELAWHSQASLDVMTRCNVLFALLDCMESLIRMKDIKWFHMGCSGKPEFKSVHEYLKRRGYVDTDIVMAKEL